MRAGFFIVFIYLSTNVFSQEKVVKPTIDKLKLFNEHYKLIDDNYIDTIDHEKFMNYVLKTTASSLDQYSKYFTKEETVLRNKAWSGFSYAGIGASVNYINNELIIEHCKKGYGADSAGLMLGDVIVEVDDTSTESLNLINAIKLLKGDPGTIVKVKVKRGSKIYEFKIKRKYIINPSVSYSGIIEHGVAVVKINQFLKGSGEEFRNEITKLIDKGAKSFILDLRGNKGGVVKECVSMLSVFFKKNTLVCELKSKDPKSNYKKYTSKEPINTSCPIVILVDSNTMSSAEIFAGAMQDLDRAVLMGNATYGKGLVQGTRFLQDKSSLYITAAKYYLPSGRSIHKNLNSKKFILSTNSKSEENFQTINKRLVKGNNGVSPDIFISKTNFHNEMVKAVSKSRLDFNYAVSIMRNKDFNEIKNKEHSKTTFQNFLFKNIDLICLNDERKWTQIKQSNPELEKSRLVNKKIEKGILNKKKKLIISSIDELYYNMNKILIYNSKHYEGLYEYTMQKDKCYNEAIKILLEKQKYKMLLLNDN